MSPTTASGAALIGDVIGSKEAPDRRQLQAALDRALDAVNVVVKPLQRLVATIGDEFQGLFGSVADAIDATLRLRILLVDDLEFRAGIGWGEFTILDKSREPFGQDGPCWWQARQALEEVARAEHSNREPVSLRTACRTGQKVDGLINAMLVMRDQVLSGIDHADAVILTALLDGRTQLQAAEMLSMHQSSVSRRMQAHGLAALLRGRSLIVTPGSFGLELQSRTQSATKQASQREHTRAKAAGLHR